ncbi:MAG: hypothetical protein IPK12_10115 [Gemmatimonadetes bacterium]|nr:hypothetical protein [Gemmatimonadota bacterium]
MMDRVVGREGMLRALRDLTARHLQSGEPLTTSRFLAAVRREAPEPGELERFVEEWLEGTALPEYQLEAASLAATAGGGWNLAVTVHNAGTGATRVQLLATGAGGGDGVRREVYVAGGGSVRVTWALPWRPLRLVVDPDADVLQQNRERAVLSLPAAPAASLPGD